MAVVKGVALFSLLVVLAVAHLVVAEPGRARDRDVNCINVDLALRACVPYLTGQVEEPPQPCCDGIVRIKAMAVVIEDRRKACSCIKEAASHLQGLKESCVTALPAKCNAPLPYPISASVDCSKIQ